MPAREASSPNRGREKSLETNTCQKQLQQIYELHDMTRRARRRRHVMFKTNHIRKAKRAMCYRLKPAPRIHTNMFDQKNTSETKNNRAE